MPTSWPESSTALERRLSGHRSFHSMRAGADCDSHRTNFFRRTDYQFAITLKARFDGHLISQMDQQSGQCTPKYIFLTVSMVEPSTLSKTMNECPLRQLKGRCIAVLPLPNGHTIPLTKNGGRFLLGDCFRRFVAAAAPEGH